MRNSLSRAPLIIAGIAMLVMGIVFIAWPNAAMSAIAIMFGLVLLFCGIANIISFAAARGMVRGGAWFLVEGIMTILLALLVLFDHKLTGFTLSVLLGIWLIFQGVNRVAEALDMRALGYSWGWTLALGIVLAVLGLVSIFFPMAGFGAISTLLGIQLVILGAGVLLHVYLSRWLWMG